MAIRNLMSYIVGGPTTITNGSFASTTFGMGITAGEADYSLAVGNIPFVSGSYNITSSELTNDSKTYGKVVTSGLTTTITLPISLYLSSLITTLGADVSIEFHGQIVAEYIAAAVPEPATLTLLGIGTLGLMGWVRHRRRRGSK